MGSALSVAGFSAGIFLSRLYQDKKPLAVRLIHQHVGDAEYSLPLLTKPTLNLAEQLQLDRLNQQIQHVQTPVVIWSKSGAVWVVFAGSSNHLCRVSADSEDTQK